MNIESLTYEQALDALESVVNDLESGKPTLEQAISLYEQGRLLSLRCTSLLEKAELRVKQLAREDDDHSMTTPLSSPMDAIKFEDMAPDSEGS